MISMVEQVAAKGHRHPTGSGIEGPDRARLQIVATGLRECATGVPSDKEAPMTEAELGEDLPDSPDNNQPTTHREI